MAKNENYVAYMRVSTTKQGISGLGLQSQRTSIDEFISNSRGTEVDSFTEIESGKSNRRPELQKALRRCGLTGAILVIAKLDRLSRDIEFIANLQKSEVSFVCVDMPEANTLTIGMMAVLAQYEREIISERTKQGLTAAKARGVVLGNPNLGSSRNRCNRNANAARMDKSSIRNIQLRATINELTCGDTDKFTLSGIANLLNDAGYTTSRNSKFTKTQVHRILK